MSSRRPVFNTVCLKYCTYRDPSLTLRMTAEGGKGQWYADSRQPTAGGCAAPYSFMSHKY